MQVSTLEPPVKTPRNINAGGRGKPVKKAPSIGGVSRGTVYAKDDFLARTKWSVHALKTAKRNGLRTATEGNLLFISGDDFCDWIQSRASK